MGTAGAANLNVEHLNNDGSVDGAPQSIPRRTTAAARLTARLSLSPGRTILRFSSYDEAGELLDRWTNDINVPDLAGPPLALATPRFLLARSAFELKALLAASEAAPAATRRVRKSDRLLVELTAYSKTVVPELIVELLNQKGESLVTLPVPASTTGRPRVEIPLQSLATATYVLKVTAKTPDAQAMQHIPFRVVP
jgi:hypothetical protein